ncbi:MULTISPECIES: hypothetical protein [unclassified Streptomyces]|uniref:hypothetical protein n=1 Tax=unclassified Streptomyces TaxID=2593676 RepID=UPI0005F8C9F1|nr:MULTISPECIES: hypothetical protein [unclassified Streptomyces]KJY20332.1 hypothetical protein VR43_16165 [Streptomyces sp. NRRL S-104]
MERLDLMRLLAGEDEASKAALAALADGADHVVWEGVDLSSEDYARGYESRRRSCQRRGIETLGWERALRLLREHAQPVRRGRITAVDGSWTFYLFLTEDGGELVACIGGRRPERRAPEAGRSAGQASP